MKSTMALAIIVVLGLILATVNAVPAHYQYQQRMSRDVAEEAGRASQSELRDGRFLGLFGGFGFGLGYPYGGPYGGLGFGYPGYGYPYWG